MNSVLGSILYFFSTLSLFIYYVIKIVIPFSEQSYESYMEWYNEVGCGIGNKWCSVYHGNFEMIMFIFPLLLIFILYLFIFMRIDENEEKKIEIR